MRVRARDLSQAGPRPDPPGLVHGQDVPDLDLVPVLVRGVGPDEDDVPASRPGGVAERPPGCSACRTGPAVRSGWSRPSPGDGGARGGCRDNRTRRCSACPCGRRAPSGSRSRRTLPPLGQPPGVCTRQPFGLGSLNAGNPFTTRFLDDGGLNDGHHVPSRTVTVPEMEPSAIDIRARCSPVGIECEDELDFPDPNRDKVILYYLPGLRRGPLHDPPPPARQGGRDRSRNPRGRGWANPLPKKPGSSVGSRRPSTRMVRLMPTFAGSNMRTTTSARRLTGARSRNGSLSRTYRGVPRYGRKDHT
jgi:hypothetical protein